MVDIAKMRARREAGLAASREHKKQHGARLMEEVEDLRATLAVHGWAVSKLIGALFEKGAHSKHCGWREGKCTCAIAKIIRRVRRRLKGK